jgi:hypothetical protein
MEMCFVNMIDPGDKVIVCRNGVFGGRMIENVQRCGGTAVVVDDRWGTPVDPQKVADALKANPDAKIVAFVHAETSTGVQSDAKTLAELARKHGCVHDRGRGHFPRRHSGIDRRVGNRRGVLGQPEVPVVHARAVSGELQRPRGRDGEEAQRKSAQLVHGHELAARILGRRQSHLPPHGADQFALCAARGAADAAGGGAGERLGAPSAATTPP